MKFRIIETHNPKENTTMYTVEKAHRGWFGIGTIWTIIDENPLGYCAMGGDWYAKKFISVQDAEAAIEKYKQNCRPITETIVKEI